MVAAGVRVYLCSFEGEAHSWVALDAAGELVTERARVRKAVSIAALCELAEDAAGAEPDEPRVASLAYLDSLSSPDVAQAVQAGQGAVEELEREVLGSYKAPLS